MIKAVIFDMDGLMIDSERVTFEEYQRKLTALGYHDFDEALYKQCLGKNKQGICQVFLDHYGCDFPMQEVWDEVHEWIDERLGNQVPKKEGLDALLNYLKKQGYATMVATSSARARVDTILKTAQLTAYFDGSICGDEVTHGKPDPEIFLKACQKLKVLPPQALVLEDSEAGIKAAYQGGIRVICIPDMKYPEPQFEAMADKLLPSLQEVIPYLEEQES